jgi:hypothetical protein
MPIGKAKPIPASPGRQEDTIQKTNRFRATLVVSAGNWRKLKETNAQNE